MKEHQSFNKDLKNKLEKIAEIDTRMSEFFEKLKYHFEEKPFEPGSFLLYEYNDEYYLRGFEFKMWAHYQVNASVALTENDDFKFNAEKLGGGKWIIGPTSEWDTDKDPKTLHIFGKSMDYGSVLNKRNIIEKLAEPLKEILGVNKIKYNFS